MRNTWADVGPAPRLEPRARQDARPRDRARQLLACGRGPAVEPARGEPPRPATGGARRPPAGRACRQAGLRHARGRGLDGTCRARLRRARGRAPGARGAARRRRWAPAARHGRHREHPLAATPVSRAARPPSRARARRRDRQLRRDRRAVVANQLDLGLVTLPISTRSLAVTPLRADPLVAIAPAAQEWRRRTTIGAAELARHPLIL